MKNTFTLVLVIIALLTGLSANAQNSTTETYVVYLTGDTFRYSKSDSLFLADQFYRDSIRMHFKQQRMVTIGLQVDGFITTETAMGKTHSAIGSDAEHIPSLPLCLDLRIIAAYHTAKTSHELSLGLFNGVIRFENSLKAFNYAEGVENRLRFVVGKGSGTAYFAMGSEALIVRKHRTTSLYFEGGFLNNRLRDGKTWYPFVEVGLKWSIFSSTKLAPWEFDSPIDVK